jgi:hypothetical protein
LTKPILPASTSLREGGVRVLEFWSKKVCRPKSEICRVPFKDRTGGRQRRRPYMVLKRINFWGYPLIRNLIGSVGDLKIWWVRVMKSSWGGGSEAAPTESQG